MLSVLPFMAITRRCWFGCPLGFCPLCELLWGKWCPSFPSDPLSNEHLSSPIHPTTPAHKFSLSESLSPIPHCLLADRTDPFASFCRSPSRHSRQCLVEVSFNWNVHLLWLASIAVTVVHQLNGCVSVAPLQSESTDGQLLLKILPSYDSICSSFSSFSSPCDPSRSSSLQKDLLPIMNLRSGFKKGRNSNILGSISMINMRSMSRWSTPQLSFLFLKV